MPTRREQLIVEVTARLSGVCGHCPPGQFADLVLRVVDTTLRYEGNGPAVRRWASDVARERKPDVQ
jgi:hypothetical protein